MHLVEIITSGILDAVHAIEGGADRVELVSALSEGGLTPSDATVRLTLETGIDTAVMVRPSSASFTYREDELKVIREDIRRFAEIGVKHIVVGVLDASGLPDMRAMDYLLDGIEMKVTFHRAIDSSADLFRSLDMLRSCKKITHVLTSGGPGKAADHIETLKKMIDSTDLRIVVGSGITTDNISYIRESLGDRKFDLHVGTAVREGGLHGVVDAALVKLCVDAAKK